MARPSQKAPERADPYIKIDLRPRELTNKLLKTAATNRTTLEINERTFVVIKL